MQQIHHPWTIHTAENVINLWTTILKSWQWHLGHHHLCFLDHIWAKGGAVKKLTKTVVMPHRQPVAQSRPALNYAKLWALIKFKCVSYIKIHPCTVVIMGGISYRDQNRFFVPGCKHVYYCCKVEDFNMRVYGRALIKPKKKIRLNPRQQFWAHGPSKTWVSTVWKKSSLYYIL